MIYYRTNKYLIKPTALQKEAIKNTMKCCTIVYNKFVEDNGFETYKYAKAKDILIKYKEENKYLNTADSSALINVLFVLQDRRLSRSEIKLKNNVVKSYTTSNLSGRAAIYFINKEIINLPHLGNLKIVMHRDMPENSKILKATISINNVNEYYISISYSFDIDNSNKKIDYTNSIGLDYSQQHFYVDSNGNECNMKHYLQLQEKRIAKLKSAVTKCRKNSINYYKLKNKIGKIYKRTTNQRNDFLHKLSTKLANEYDLICVENIDMQEIASHYSMAKNTYDNGYGKFLTYLKYKLEDRGKMLIVIDKYFPSSKMCNKCGYINEDLKLSDREWKCPKCGEVLNRDINAAINIRNRGIQEFTSIGYLDKAYKIGSIPH